MAWAAAYAALLIVTLVLVSLRREPTVVRGDWVFLVTSLFLIAATVITALRGGRFSVGPVIAAALVLAVGWLARSRWLIIGASPPAVGATIDECGSRLCAAVERSTSDVAIAIPGGAMRLRVTPLAGGSTLIVFVTTPPHRKADLFRRLLAKQYRPVLPTIRLGTLGGANTA